MTLYDLIGNLTRDLLTTLGSPKDLLESGLGDGRRTDLVDHARIDFRHYVGFAFVLSAVPGLEIVDTAEGRTGMDLQILLADSLPVAIMLAVTLQVLFEPPQIFTFITKGLVGRPSAAADPCDELLNLKIFPGIILALA
jgi:hypothetical protein